MAGKSGGFLGCARNKTEMLGISGMRWYMATALECSSVVVDTMSWRAMVTYIKEEHEQITTYYRNTRHRLDGPAEETADGSKWWRVNGKLHRVDGPAIEYASGSKAWYVQGKRHRLDGPAVEHADGSTIWYVNGKRHRLDGPVVEYVGGGKEWWVAGVRQK